MKFVFNIGQKSEVALAMGRTAFNRLKNSHSDKVDKIWVREAIVMFAGKCDIQFGQACMVLQTGGIDRIQQMHRIAAMKLPPFIQKMNEDGRLVDIKNPLREKLTAFGDMKPHDHIAMCREHLAWAFSIRHPKDPIPKGHSREHQIASEILNKPDHRQHPDETRHAHRQRLAAALAAALNPTNDNIEKLGRAFGF